MRTLVYEVVSPEGPEWRQKSGDLVSLLLDCPFFFVGKVIPPMEALDDFLRVGDASISCRWPPLQLEPADYSDLVSELERRQFRLITAPDWVSTYEEWRIWCAEIVWGIPALERRKIHEQKLELEMQMEKAEKAADYATTAGLLKHFLELQVEDARFISERRLEQPLLPVL